MKRKIILAALAVCLLVSVSPLQAEDEYVPTYTLGNQLLIINGGLFIPLFYQALSGKTFDSNLSLGGVGSIQWAAHLNNNMTLGLEGGGMFAFSPNDRSLFMLPVTVRYAYILKAYPFEFPLSVSSGINFTRLGHSFQILPIVKPGISGYWNYSPEWAFGLNCFYWWVPNLYNGPEPPKSQSRLGNFLEVSLSAMYHF